MLLIITAAIWGFAFVAQRLGMQSLDPMTYNAIRFAMGALFVWVIAARKCKRLQAFPWLMGLVLFIAASFQQIGILYTSAGSAGFITGLYVVIVPVMGLFRRQKVGRQLILAILLAIGGMFLINRPGNLEMSMGNLLVLVSAVFFAWHVQLVDYYGSKFEVAYLAFSQFALVAALSAFSALFYHLFKAPAYLISAKFGADVWKAALPLLYGGLMSVGIAYTLQIKAQQKAEPGKAALIMCMEGVFALFGGWLILQETLDLRIFIGAGL
ncbi:MAG: DMT family transporter, partial [Candidatus Cloacimonas sp.]|nr:DMT family transporter [Candidatus Cloacimonas sp.]